MQILEEGSSVEYSRYIPPREGERRIKEAREPNPSCIGPKEIIECVENKQFRFWKGK